jgi:hypothetical protein
VRDWRRSDDDNMCVWWTDGGGIDKQAHSSRECALNRGWEDSMAVVLRASCLDDVMDTSYLVSHSSVDALDCLSSLLDLV